MERYSEYKDSGVQWLGEIPGHWKCTRLKYITSKIGSGSTPTGGADVYQESGVLFLRSQNIYNYGLELDDVAHISEIIHQEMKGTHVQSGDILYNITGGSIGRCCLAPESLGEANVNQHVSIVRPRNISNKYLLYSLQSDYCQTQMWFLQTGGNREGLSAFAFKKFNITIPPLSEQHSIVSYLDDKCGKIDKMLEGKQKQIELLAEMKQRIIADAVTHGLNPDVKMKATNIPWLPEIPEHWEVKPIRAILRENNEKSETGTEELLSLSQYTGVSRKKDVGKTGMFEAESTIGYKKVHSGQFVMNIMLAWNGSYAVSGLEGIISPAYCVFDFISNDNKMYYNYLWRLGIYQGAFKTESRGIIDSRLRLYPNKFLPFPTICPPLDEQHSIVSYITDKTVKIDTLTSKLQQEIESIKEYKQRLISDVVTGQIKVC